MKKFDEMSCETIKRITNNIPDPPGISIQSEDMTAVSVTKVYSSS